MPQPQKKQVSLICPSKPFEPKPLGRKHIKSFASGIAHMFSCSAQHYAWLAYQHRLPTVTIDLLALRIEPLEFDIERNRILAGMCRSTLRQNCKRLTPPAAVSSAVLSAHFGIDDYADDGYFFTSIGRSVFTVTLTDDQGRVRQVDLVRERVLIQS